METSKALKIIADFKVENLKQNLNDLRANLIGKGKNKINQPLELYEAALEVKRLSAQIDEMLHASGIIKCLPFILDEDEVIESLSLASGADGEGIDLVTNKRIAEFKFARWQVGKANGMRKRQVFADLVTLFLHPTTKSKELYVFNAEMVISFFSSKKSTWKNVLSKSGGLDIKLEKHLTDKNNNGLYLNDVYFVSNVQVLDIDDILK